MGKIRGGGKRGNGLEKGIEHKQVEENEANSVFRVRVLSTTRGKHIVYA